MKTFVAWFFVACAMAVTTRPEDASAKAVPQPRVRLSPETHPRVMPPAPSAANKPAAAATPATMMEKVVVKETGIPARSPANPADHKGDFTWRDGGAVARGQTRSVEGEIGAWPWLPWTDVMAEEAVKFPKRKTSVEVEFVRVHW